jgi:putative NADPH-quinone reductase
MTGDSRARLHLSAVRALVVLSHPEPSSFAAALARTAADVLDGTLLDLYAEGFDPRLSAAASGDGRG